MGGPTWLIVDLDKTLIRSDLFEERWVSLSLRRPLTALRLLLGSLFYGRVWMKDQLAQAVPFSPERLPYNQSVLQLIKEAKNHNQKIGLISASHASWVQAVSDHLGIFDFTAGSKTVNLKGRRKVQLVQELSPQAEWRYVGDSLADLPIWEACQGGIACNPGWLLSWRLRKFNGQVTTIRDSKSLFAWLRLLRPHQWSKNILVFTAPLAAHTLFSGPSLIHSALGFIGFCAMASAVYIINDLLDLEADRVHPSKRKRPLAAGEVSPISALMIAALLITGSLYLAGEIPSASSTVLPLGFYFLANLSYSIWIKKQLVLDLIFLSLMYTLRIYVGAIATNTAVSHWLLSFSTFLFFGLACLKRIVELERSQSGARAYQVVDKLPLTILGSVSTFCSLLVMILYFNSNEVRALYHSPDRLWALVPLALYFLSRIWILCSRGEVHDDPVVYALTDYRQHIVLALGGLVLWSAL